MYLMLILLFPNMLLMSHDYEKIATLLAEETAIPVEKRFLLATLLRKSPHEETREKIAAFVLHLSEKKNELLAREMKSFQKITEDTKATVYHAEEIRLSSENEETLHALLSDIDN